VAVGLGVAVGVGVRRGVAVGVVVELGRGDAVRAGVGETVRPGVAVGVASGPAVTDGLADPPGVPVAAIGPGDVLGTLLGLALAVTGADDVALGALLGVGGDRVGPGRLETPGIGVTATASVAVGVGVGIPAIASVGRAEASARRCSSTPPMPTAIEARTRFSRPRLRTSRTR
jgi:hypothetical protein